MKIKSSANQKKELAFLIGGSVMIAGLVIYLIFLIRHISSRADIIFRIEGTDQNIASFDFEKYNELISKIFPSSTVDQSEKIK